MTAPTQHATIEQGKPIAEGVVKRLPQVLCWSCHKPISWGTKPVACQPHVIQCLRRDCMAYNDVTEAA